MEDIEEIIRHTNWRDGDAIAEAKERIRQILIAKAEYMRDIAKMCEVDANVMVSALLRNDIATAERLCEAVVRGANKLVSKGIDLRRDIAKAEDFGGW